MKTVLLSVVSLLLVGVPGQAQPPLAEDVKSFDVVWKTVNERHFDATFAGTDWQAMRDRYRPQLVSSSDTDAFERITNRMLFELRLSHLLVATETRLKTVMPRLFAAGSPGIDVRWRQRRAVITRITPGSSAHEAGLAPGYAITRIGGRDVHAIVRAAEALPPYNVRNRNATLANYLLGHLNGPPGTSVSIRYGDDRSREQEAVLIRQTRGAGTIVSDAMPPVFIEFESRRLAHDIGYVWFNHFAAPVDSAFVDALETMRDTRGLIVDVRGNPGGYFRVMDTLIANLISVETVLYRFRFRDRTVTRTVSPAKRPYRQPVVVLIDETSMSSSEHFAACLQAIGRAIVVGARSPGYLLGAHWIKLPNGLSFMHTILEPIPFGGRTVEGKGVRPDLAIALDREALLAGRDAQLEGAIARLLKTSLP